MAKKSLSAYQNPLDWYLDTDPEDYGHLTILARKVAAEPFAENSFRAELKAKLERLKYQPERLTGDEKTFNKILTDAGVLGWLLEPSMLRDLWKCILLKKIIESDRRLKEQKRAVDGQELRFHSKQAAQIRNDLRVIREIAARHNVANEAEILSEELDSQYCDHMRILLISTVHRSPRGELLSSRSAQELGRKPRDEDAAVTLAIYRTLKKALQTTVNKRRGISDYFLCQLADLITAPPDVQRLKVRNVQSFSKYVARSG